MADPPERRPRTRALGAAGSRAAARRRLRTLSPRPSWPCRALSRGRAVPPRDRTRAAAACPALRRRAASCEHALSLDRKSVEEGKRGTKSVDLGGCRIIKKKKKNKDEKKIHTTQ